MIQFCTAHPQQFRNVFFGPENRNGIRAGQYIDDIGKPLFQRFVHLFFEVARDEGLPSKDDMVVAHTWWYTIFGLATLMVIQGVVPDRPGQTLVVEQTIATLWAGVKAVPRLPKSAITKRSGRATPKAITAFPDNAHIGATSSRFTPNRQLTFPHAAGNPPGAPWRWSSQFLKVPECAFLMPVEHQS